MKRGCRIFVLGRVQGVFFRRFTKENASELELNGWVRNLSDGRVEIFVEGDVDKIKNLIKKVRQGPRSAEVSGVDIEWSDYEGSYDVFKIIR